MKLIILIAMLGLAFWAVKLAASFLMRITLWNVAVWASAVYLAHRLWVAIA